MHGFGYAFQGDTGQDDAATRETPFCVSHEGRDIMLMRGENLLGRSRECRVRIDSARVSRRHARITIDGDAALIEDCGSTNGTWVNGVRVQEQALFPGDVIRIVRDQVIKLSQGNAGGVLTFAFLLTLWSSSSAVVSMCSTLNAAYDITETRPWWKVRLTAIGLTIALALFILISMTLVIAGPTLAERLADTMQLGPVFEWTWKLLQWPVVLAIVAGALATILRFGPDTDARWPWTAVAPGAILAALLWLLFSIGFRFYLTRFGAYGAYGAIGGVIVLLLWFYTTGLAGLVGAELNVVIHPQRVKREQAVHAAPARLAEHPS